jgi:hypothetical protein
MTLSIMTLSIMAVMLQECVLITFTFLMYGALEQRTFKNLNNYFNANIYSNLETSGGQSSNLYLNAVHFFNTNVN